MDRLQALQVSDNGLGISVRELAVGVVRHDWHELPTVGSDAGPHCLDDVGLASLTEPGLGIRGEIGRVEDAKAGDLEADLRSGQRTLHVRLAEERAGRMAAGAIHDGHQVLAALGLVLHEGRRN